MKMFQVIPNPYRTLDGNGKPTQVFPCHQKHAPGKFVGATKTLDVREKATFVNVKSKSGAVRSEVASFDQSKAVFSFSFDPVDVPAEGDVGAYYRRGVKTGDLIPANKKTADACGVAFVDPAEVLAAEKNKAAKEFSLQFGEMPEWATSEKPASASAAQK